MPPERVCAKGKRSRVADSAEAEWSRTHRPCVICLANKHAYAEALVETGLWKFYYCPTGLHWFQASIEDEDCTEPIVRKAKIRALTLLYTEQQEQQVALATAADPLRRAHKRKVSLSARAYLKVSRLVKS